MRLLIVAMSESVHTARWLRQLSGLGWDIHLFPSNTDYISPELRDVTVHTQYLPATPPHPSVRVRASCRVQSRHANLAFRAIAKAGRMIGIGRGTPASEKTCRTRRLATVIRTLKPTLVHSLEIQCAGYLTLGVRELGALDVPWIVTNWGSDVYLFGRLAEHAPKIRQVLARCDYYSCECHRDVKLAREMGLTAPVLPVYPNAGGFDLDALGKKRQPGPTSKRGVFVLKGYQNWAGRALVGLKAFELIGGDILRKYRIVTYTCTDDVKMAAELTAQKIGVPIEVLPHLTHDVMMDWFGQARVYLGLSISDGICTSMLESMVMGAFPIQSDTACADEWITDGVSGIIVPADDPHAVAAALHRALTDDALVDQAAAMNAQVAATRLDLKLARPLARKFYEQVVSGSVEEYVPRAGCTGCGGRRRSA